MIFDFDFLSPFFSVPQSRTSIIKKTDCRKNSTSVWDNFDWGAWAKAIESIQNAGYSDEKYSTKDGILSINLELAGFSKEDLEITYVDEALSIDAKHGESCRKYSYIISSEIYDMTSISAEMNNGLLTIKIPLKIPQEKEKEARKIQIK